MTSCPVLSFPIEKDKREEGELSRIQCGGVPSLRALGQGFADWTPSLADASQLDALGPEASWHVLKSPGMFSWVWVAGSRCVLLEYPKEIAASGLGRRPAPAVYSRDFCLPRGRKSTPCLGVGFQGAPFLILGT